MKRERHVIRGQGKSQTQSGHGDWPRDLDPRSNHRKRRHLPVHRGIARQRSEGRCQNPIGKQRACMQDPFRAHDELAHRVRGAKHLVTG